jgi:hypothetical protein
MCCCCLQLLLPTAPRTAACAGVGTAAAPAAAAPGAAAAGKGHGGVTKGSLQQMHPIGRLFALLLLLQLDT